MNILIMSKIFANSGVGSHIMDLSENLAGRGNTVFIMSGTNDHEDFCNDKKISFTYIDFAMAPNKFVRNIYVIINFIKKNRIEIVHCHHRTCAFYMNIISKLTGVPFVWSNHLDNIPSDFIHRHTTFIGKQAICVSTDLKKFCIDKLHIPANKISVVYNGIHPERYIYDVKYVQEFRKKHQIGDKKVIGLFARMAPVKGHINLINAVSTIPEEKMQHHVVVFFGGGVLSRIMSEA